MLRSGVKTLCRSLSRLAVGRPQPPLPLNVTTVPPLHSVASFGIRNLSNHRPGRNHSGVEMTPEVRAEIKELVDSIPPTGFMVDLWQNNMSIEHAEKILRRKYKMEGRLDKQKERKIGFETRREKYRIVVEKAKYRAKMRIQGQALRQVHASIKHEKDQREVFKKLKRGDIMPEPPIIYPY